jgi:hypothetical protein
LKKDDADDDLVSEVKLADMPGIQRHITRIKKNPPTAPAPPPGLSLLPHPPAPLAQEVVAALDEDVDAVAPGPGDQGVIGSRESPHSVGPMMR